MGRKHSAVAMMAIAIAASLTYRCLAAPPGLSSANEEVDKLTGVAEFKVRVVDADGRPVSKAKVTPWALRSSQGHGLWLKDDKYCDLSPSDTWTDTTGITTATYPYFRDRDEQIRTTQVSLRVDHPDFALAGDVHVDVPLTTTEAHEIKLAIGATAEVRPLLDGKVARHENLLTLWSDGRSWQPGFAPQRSADGTLSLSGMPAGANSVLLVTLDGDHAMHFSRITDFDLTLGETKRLDVELRPGVCVRGRLSDNVPRPVRAGRVRAESLNPAEAMWDRVQWMTWVPIRPDGTFVIDTWPADEPLQLIALCEGFIAENGTAPEEVKNAPRQGSGMSCRPQVFRPCSGGSIELAMTPLVRCNVTAVDEDDKPVAGVEVFSYPNVQWWNSGSQFYGSWLVRGERLVRVRDVRDSVENAYPNPFIASTDAHGRVTLELPSGRQFLDVKSDVYELPVFLGRREVDVRLNRGKTTDVALRLQPMGTEKLGEWDKLAGVVFGCSTREGRRICALPKVREQMDVFAARFREAKSRRDPQLLSEAYSAVADAFMGVGDVEEATKWRERAAEQAAKLRDEPHPSTQD